MAKFLKHYEKFLFIFLEGIIILGFVFLRLTSYGVWNDSVSTMDTQSYLDTAKLPITSVEFWTAIRSPTYPILLKALSPLDSYVISHKSIPIEHAEGNLILQPGFDRVVIFQMWMSIFSWLVLVLVLFHYIQNKWIGMLTSIAILFFCFSPQIADWDSIIMTESLSFSLFALISANLIEIFFYFRSGKSNKLFAWFLMGCFVFLSLLWVLLRDTNVYFLLLTIIFLLVFLFFTPSFKKDLKLSIYVTCILLLVIFIFHQITFRASERWLVPFYNNVTLNIFPYPERVNFFKKFGMPTSPKILAIRGSIPFHKADAPADFINWSKKNGLSVYSYFLLSHPAWALRSVWESLDSFFEINTQPYFFVGEYERPN